MMRNASTASRSNGSDGFDTEEVSKPSTGTTVTQLPAMKPEAESQCLLENGDLKDLLNASQAEKAALSCMVRDHADKVDGLQNRLAAIGLERTDRSSVAQVTVIRTVLVGLTDALVITTGA